MTYFKAQFSALIATAVDFSITVALSRLLGCCYLTSVFVGTLSGGIINFYINRDWVFTSVKPARRGQPLRYMIACLINIFLVTLGVYFLTEHFDLNYMLSKVLVSIVLGCSYSYLIQKYYIFN